MYVYVLNLQTKTVLYTSMHVLTLVANICEMIFEKILYMYIYSVCVYIDINTLLYLHVIDLNRFQNSLCEARMR